MLCHGVTGPKCEFAKVMTLEGQDQGHRPKTNSTISFLDLNNTDLDAKIAILYGLVQKLWSKTYFCKNVGNVRRLHTSHVQTAQDIS